MANFEEKKTDQKEQLMGEEALDKIRGLLKHFRSAMLTTVTPVGVITTRPMGVVGDPETFDGTLWFFADDRSPKAQLVKTGAHTALILQNDHKNPHLHMTRRPRGLAGLGCPPPRLAGAGRAAHVGGGRAHLGGGGGGMRKGCP